jgi:hypothetical protein
LAEVHPSIQWRLGNIGVVAVLMPQSWLIWCVSKVEPGLHVDLLVSYLSRALSLYFFLVGLLLIVFAKDVRHYKAPIRIITVWCLFATLSFGIYAFLYLPYIMKQWFFWFIVIDGIYSLVTVLAILILQSGIENDHSSKHGFNMGLHLDAAPRRE